MISKNHTACKHKISLIGLKKAQSLLGKIIDMIADDKYCIDIMQQNLAAIGLLKAVNQQLLEGHLNSCFKTVMQSKNEAKKDEMTREILQVSKLSNK